MGLDDGATVGRSVGLGVVGGGRGGRIGSNSVGIGVVRTGAPVTGLGVGASETGELETGASVAGGGVGFPTGALVEPPINGVGLSVMTTGGGVGGTARPYWW